MEEQDRLELALAKAHSAVYEWDTEDDRITWIGNLENVICVSDAGRIACKDDLIACIHPEDREKFLTSLEASLEGRGDYTKSYRIRLADGTTIPVTDKGTVYDDDGHMLLVGTLSSPILQTPMSTMILPATTVMGRDTHYSTDYARPQFLDQLCAAFATSTFTGKNNVLLLVSIDNLPMLMTWYSLEFADRVMAALEFNLTDLLRKGDVINRTAIDQFSIILKNHSEGEAELVVDRILRRIQLYNNPSFEEPIHLRCSLGSVQFPADADSADDAMNKAYLALASARDKRNEFHVDYRRARRENLDVKEETGRMRHMQAAFRDRRIKLAYQPIVLAKDGKIKGYECLLRINYEDGETGSLGELIPIAEKMGIIDMVDQYVLEEVVAELANYPEIPSLSFNVSNLTTNNPKWLKHCTKLLKECDVARRLIVEITETAAQSDMRQTAYFVAALQEMGCQVALDDFGAGYTNFRQLKSLSVDMVKIDGSYILGLQNNSENLLFIKTLLEFNRAYGLATIAECVESGEVAKILMDIEVDYLQGNYFGAADTARSWAGEKHSIEERKR